MYKSAMLYMWRKKRVLRQLSPRPTFMTNSLSIHHRPHNVIPAISNVEQVNKRLAIQPIDSTPAYKDQ